MKRTMAALALLAAPTPLMAKPVNVRLEWVGNDATGGVLVSRVRGLIAASASKRETFERRDGLSVIVQTLDPALEWQDGIAAQDRITVYSLTINRRSARAKHDTFAGAALGYCAQADLAGCAREVVDAIDEQIPLRGLR